MNNNILFGIFMIIFMFFVCLTFALIPWIIDFWVYQNNGGK